MADLMIPPCSAAPMPVPATAWDGVATGLPVTDPIAGRSFGRLLEESLAGDGFAPSLEGGASVDESNEALLSVLGPAGAMLPPQLVSRLLATTDALSAGSTAAGAGAGASTTALLDAFIARRTLDGGSSDAPTLVAATPSASTAPATALSPNGQISTVDRHTPADEHTPAASEPRAATTASAPALPTSGTPASVAAAISAPEARTSAPTIVDGALRPNVPVAARVVIPTAATDESNTTHNGLDSQTTAARAATSDWSQTAGRGAQAVATAQPAQETLPRFSAADVRVGETATPIERPTVPLDRLPDQTQITQAAAPTVPTAVGARPTVERGDDSVLSRPAVALAATDVLTATERASDPMPQPTAERVPAFLARASLLLETGTTGLISASHETGAVARSAIPGNQPATVATAIQTPLSAAVDGTPVLEPDVASPAEEIIRSRLESLHLDPSVRLSGLGRASTTAVAGDIPVTATGDARPQGTVGRAPAEGATVFSRPALQTTGEGAPEQRPTTVDGATARSRLSAVDAPVTVEGMSGVPVGVNLIDLGRLDAARSVAYTSRAPGSVQTPGMSDVQAPGHGFVAASDAAAAHESVQADDDANPSGSTVAPVSVPAEPLVEVSADDESTPVSTIETAQQSTAPAEPVAVTPVAPRPEPSATGGDPAANAPDAAQAGPSDPVRSVVPTVMASASAGQAVDQVASALAMSIRNGRTEVNIALRPDALGAVNVRIVAGDEGLVIHIRAERDEAGDLLRSQINELRQALVNHQVAVNEIHVLHNPPPVPPTAPNQPAPWPEERTAPEHDGERGGEQQTEEREQNEE